MKIDINNAQYMEFTRFAATAAKNSTILKAEKALGGKDAQPQKIVDKGRDFVGNIGRWKDNRDVNDEVRRVFKETILKMFGVQNEKQLPENVQEAMLLKDYGKGKPLTARRIIAVNKAIMETIDTVNENKISLAKARLLVNNSVKHINASITQLTSSNKVPFFPAENADLDAEQIDVAAKLVAKHSVGLTNTCIRILTNYIVTAIASGIYEDEDDDGMDGVKEMAKQMADSLRNARNFTFKDPRMAEFDAKHKEYWQSMIADEMNSVKGDKYNEDGFHDSFMKDCDRGNFCINGETYTKADKKADEMLGKIKQLIPNVQHRKAISTLMNQMTSIYFHHNLSNQAPMPKTTKFPKLNLNAVPGGELLLSVDGSNDMFTDTMTVVDKSEYILEVNEKGTKARVATRSVGDIRFNIDNAHEWGLIPMGKCAYDVEFEFDLSNPRQAKLTAVHLSQTFEA